MPRISPTLEGLRAALRRPSLALGEIIWRWVVGATATVLFFLGLIEYLSTLPVTNGEVLFLRTRQPYLVAQAILHILRGTLDRVVMSAILAVLCLALLWMISASLGRIATVRAIRDYMRGQLAARFSAGIIAKNLHLDEAKPSTARPLGTLLRLNFLRATLALSAIIGFVGTAILAGYASPDADPHPELAFLLFLPLAALVGLAWSALNWLLSLAAMFAARDGEDAVGAISAAVGLCRERTSAVFAVSAWTGVAHLVAFVGATTVIFTVIGFAGLVPGRIVTLGLILIMLAYFAVADWFYTARLAGYVCIAEAPDALLRPLPPPIAHPNNRPAISPEPTLQTTIDRDETILSDVTSVVAEV